MPYWNSILTAQIYLKILVFKISQKRFGTTRYGIRKASQVLDMWRNWQHQTESCLSMAAPRLVVLGHRPDSEMDGTAALASCKVSTALEKCPQ